MSFTPSLVDLSNFEPQTPEEKAIFENVKGDVIQDYLIDSLSTWSKGTYYMGGQIPLKPLDPITPAFMKKVRKAWQDSDKYVCNSYEAASVHRAATQLAKMEIYLAKYIEVQKLRIHAALETTKLNTDVNNTVVSFL
jgi:hypothetical protein